MRIEQDHHLYTARVSGGYTTCESAWITRWFSSDEEARNKKGHLAVEGMASTLRGMEDILLYYDTLHPWKPSLEEIVLKLYDITIYRLDDKLIRDIDDPDELGVVIANGMLPEHFMWAI